MDITEQTQISEKPYGDLVQKGWRAVSDLTTAIGLVGNPLVIDVGGEGARASYLLTHNPDTKIVTTNMGIGDLFPIDGSFLRSDNIPDCPDGNRHCFVIGSDAADLFFALPPNSLPAKVKLAYLLAEVQNNWRPVDVRRRFPWAAATFEDFPFFTNLGNELVVLLSILRSLQPGSSVTVVDVLHGLKNVEKMLQRIPGMNTKVDAISASTLKQRGFPNKYERDSASGIMTVLKEQSV